MRSLSALSYLNLACFPVQWQKLFSSAQHLKTQFPSGPFMAARYENDSNIPSHGLDYGRKGFTAKSVAVALFLSAFLVASSSYIALRLGALPWPIIFSVIAGAALLRIFGRFSSHELNVAHAGASVGGLVASALVFTVPALAFLRNSGMEVPNLTLWAIMLVVLSAGLLGVFVSVPIRRQLVDVEDLPFPSGTAGAKLILAGFKGGFLVWLALVSGILAALFAVSRDIWFPAGLTLLAIPSISLVLSVYPMPIALGVGYILKPRAALSWFAGSLISSAVLVPVLSAYRFAEPVKLVQNLGMGLLFGAGLGLLAYHVFSSRRKVSSSLLFSSRFSVRIIVLSLLSLIVLYLVSVPFAAALLTVLLTLVAVFIAARMTGETNIDPLEQFGIVIAVACAALYSVFHLDLSILHLLVIVIFASVATAVAGDIGHDYKAAKIVGTRARDIVRVDVLSVIVAALLGPFVLAVLLKGFSRELFTSSMPAPQSQLVAAALTGFAHPSVFVSGIIAGFLLEIVLRRKQSVPFVVMPFAIGLFLGFPLGFVVGLGGLLSWFALRRNLFDKGVVVAAGIMGGEGIIGFSMGALSAAGINTGSFLAASVPALAAVLVLTLGFGMRKGYFRSG
ncbi:hypothetical protein D6764_02145 [Candidatus Woesearchaeota archaeon]|nr:MAG: hypothetical protein D6764_02145 [Candidatus Woesearchaeota archaeon]